LRDAARLSARNIRRRSVLPLFLALLVPAASIMAPLMMGASFQATLKEEIFRGLGQVDEMVRSKGMMRPGIFEALKSDTTLAGMTDGLAPALILPGILTGPTGKRDPNVDFIGVDGNISSLGDFRAKDGASLNIPIPAGEAYVREDAALKVYADPGDNVLATLQDPEYSLESVYTPGAQLTNASMEVGAVVKEDGLGALDLAPRGVTRRTVFVDLAWLQGITGKSGFNTILVSNNGDARGGVAMTNEVAKYLRTRLDELAGLEEGGFAVFAENGYAKLESSDIFFNKEYAQKVRNIGVDVSSVSVLTTYFVNMLMKGDRRVAYSTVTAFDPVEDAPFGKFYENGSGLATDGAISDKEMVLTSYTAGRLNASVGDMVTLNYTVYDRYFQKSDNYADFTVKHIVDLDGKADDPGLMPPFPGIKGKTSCGDWKPPVPIDYGIMVGEDLAYWQTHGGAPKAYITLAQGQRMWGNDLGNITTVKALPASGVTVDQLATRISLGLNSSLSAPELGVVVVTVKLTSLQSVGGLGIVTESLVSFGSAVTLSGMVLIIVVVQTNIESRKREIGILRSLGISRRGIAGMFTLEGVMLSLGASAMGTLVGAMFAWLGVLATNMLWSVILPVKAAFFAPDALTTIAGFAGGFIASVMAFALGARSASRGSVVAVLRALPEEKSGTGTHRPRKGAALAELVAAITVLALVGYFLSRSAGEMVLLVYFVIGDLMVLAAGLIIHRNIEGLSVALSSRMRSGRIALMYPTRFAKRTTAYVLVYALVTFPLITLFAYAPMQGSGLDAQTELRGGGYDVLGISNAPLFFDITNESERVSRNITDFPSVSELLPILSFGSQGGTCSNLNSKAPPRLLGANAAFASESKIPFAQTADGSTGKKAWSLLERTVATDIPVFADYTTAVWILQKGIGDRLRIADEEGKAVDLKLAGILHDSIFQGSVFISEGNLRALYPTQSQYDHFLLKVGSDVKGTGGDRDAQARAVADSFGSALADYGMSARPVKEIVAELISVDLAYASMLQAMMVSGVLLGTLGFGAKVAREALERRHELGVMRAIGFKKRSLLGLLVGENLFIFALGFGAALLAASLSAILFLGVAPPLFETLVLLAFLVAVIAAATLAPLRRTLGSTAADNLRIAE